MKNWIITIVGMIVFFGVNIIISRADKIANSSEFLSLEMLQPIIYSIKYKR